MSIPDSDRLIGMLGFVTTRIGGNGKPGEVQVPLHGGSEAFIAYGDEVLERGVQILVIGKRTGRAVEVTAFNG
jgi:hypothetical protein